MNTGSPGCKPIRATAAGRAFIPSTPSGGSNPHRPGSGGPYSDTPLDGAEELIVALHDIAEVVSRPALARLAKIGGVAEEVVTAAPAAHSPDKATRTGRTSPPG